MPVVQTYLTQSFANKLSKELKTEVTVKGVDIELLKTIVLEHVLIKDLHFDTLLYIEKFAIAINDYNLDSNYVNISHTTLNNVSFYLKKYKQEKELNVQFLVDYFSSNDTSKTRWVMGVNALIVSNVHFKFKDENSLDTALFGVNFKDIDATIETANFTKIQVVGDTISTTINNFVAHEKSGLKIKQLSSITSISSKHTSLTNLNLETNNSLFKGNFNLSYSNYEDYAYFINKVHIESKLDSSLISLSDFGYVVPKLRNVENKFIVSTVFSGNINSFTLSNLSINYEDYTTFKGDVVMSGLPDIEHTFIYLNNIDLHTHYSDISKIQFPNNRIELPKELKQLGTIKFHGNYKGLLSEFEVKGDFITQIGTVGTNVKYTMSEQTNYKQYEGNITATNFDIGKLLNTEDVGKITFDFKIKGTGVSSQNAKINLQGKVNSVELLKYDYQDIDLEGDVSNGLFSGFVEVDDKNAYFRFDGIVDFSEKVPSFQFVSTIQNVNLGELNIAPSSCNCSLSMLLETDFKGLTIDDLEGKIGVYQTEYIQGEKQLVIKKVELLASNKEKERKLTLVSDVVNGEIEGYFKTGDVYKTLQHMVYQSFPSLHKEHEELKVDSVLMNFNFKVAEVDDVTAIFAPQLKLTKSLDVLGVLDSKKNTFELSINNEELEYNSINFSQFSLRNKSKNGIIQLDISLNKIELTEGVELLNYEFFSKGVNDLVQFETSFDNQDSTENFANIGGIYTIESPHKSAINLFNSNISIDGYNWSVTENNSIIIDSTSISVKNLQLTSDSQLVIIEGKITQNPKDKILVLLDNIELSTFNRFFTGSGLTLSGIANGNAVFSDPYNEFIFTTDLNLKELIINADSIGVGNINANWKKEAKAININGFLGNEFSFVGNYFPTEKGDNLDIVLTMENLGLTKFEPFVEGVLSDIKGDLSGVLKIKGTINHPKVRGVLNLVNSGLTVDYLNTSYTLHNEYIIIEEDWFGFDIITIEDRHGGIATATGTIVHEGFKNMNFDVTLFPNYLECLNTSEQQNPLYYGNAYASGIVNISGYADKMIMDINVKTEKGTDFYIPLDGSQEYSEKDYIKFVVKDSAQLAQQEDYSVNLDGMEMNFDLEITPEAKMQIIFDEKIGDIIKTQGQGQLKMAINSAGDFNIFGNYEITDGDYLFTLENIINKKFLVAPGSTISFDGDPTDAILDVTAIYKLKAPLKDLGIGDIDTSGKRITVDCHLIMKESLTNPTLNFDLDLPTSSEHTNSAVKTAINSNNSMNKQVFSLLMVNRFVPVTDRGGFTAGGAGSASSTELLSNQLSNWLSQISDDFDVGLNYRAGNDVSSREVEVALSTQLFNDRVTVETNVGVTGSNPNSSSSSSNIAGDFNLEYKISKEGKFRGRVYNQSNDYNDINTNNIKYTQGVGLFYTEEFNTFGDFFRNLFGKNK